MNAISRGQTAEIGGPFFRVNGFFDAIKIGTLLYQVTRHQFLQEVAL